MRNLLLFLTVSVLLAGCGAGNSAEPEPSERPASSADLPGVLAAVRNAASLPAVPPDLTPAIATAGDDVGFDRLTCEAAPAADRIDDPCVFGDPQGQKHVFLYGDSHAGMWLPAVRMIAEREHWRLEFYGKPACPAPRLTFWNQQEARPFLECDRFRDFVLSRVRQARPDLVVVTNESFSQKRDRDVLVPPEQWRSGLTATLTTLAGSASRVVVLGDTPVLAQSAPECLAAHASNVTACFTTRANATARIWNGADEAAAKAAGAGYVPVLPWLCGPICTPVIGNMLVYRNRFHLTGTYARMLSGVLEDALRQAATASDGTP